MIHFACPVWKTELREQRDRAGAKMTCPTCGQRLQVPYPATQKTVLGSMLPGGHDADMSGHSIDAQEKARSQQSTPRSGKAIGDILGKSNDARA
jgi:hypothetical protein